MGNDNPAGEGIESNPLGNASTREGVALSSASSQFDLNAVRDAAIVISVAAGIAVELTYLKGTLQDFFGDGYTWATALSIVIAVVLVGWIVVWPRYTRWTRHHQLGVVAARSKVLSPGHFSLRPLSAADAERFVRLDKVHESVHEWLKAASDPIVYITGTSGAGKSSLLNAYVIPKFGDFTVCRIRGFGDAVADLMMQLTTANVIWDRPPIDASHDPRDALEKVGEYLIKSKRHLLIVFDQFEEVIIIHDRFAATAAPVVDLLKSLTDDTVDGIRLLIVMRTDYIGKLRSLQLPPVEDGRNWVDVPPFSVPAGIDFLVRGGIDQPVAVEAVQQGSRFEDLQGVVRPITLNFLGVILERTPDALRGRRFLTLQQGFLESRLSQWINDPLIRDHSHRILSAMITGVGTKHARRLEEIAAETCKPADVIENCLVILQTKGLVRCIDDVTGIWEISHDFVARRLDSVIAASRKTSMQRAVEHLPVATAVVWGILFLLVPWLWGIQRIHECESAFYTGGGRVSEIEDGQKCVSFVGQNVVTLDALAHVNSLQGVTAIDLSSKAFMHPVDLSVLRSPTVAILDLSASPLPIGSLGGGWLA